MDKNALEKCADASLNVRRIKINDVQRCSGHICPKLIVYSGDLLSSTPNTHVEEKARQN
jgi:hypothetical protein